MISDRNVHESIALQDLHPGDIITWMIMGTRHFAIYSPVAGQQGDLVHMFYNSRNECAVFKSTISQPLQHLPEGQDITVIRSRTKDEGRAFADQAEVWLRQGINYDFNRLSQVLYNNTHHVAPTAVEENILQYLKYTARRDTMPVKSREFPIINMNWMTKAGLFFVGSNYVCDPMPRMGMKLVDFSVASPNRSKGLNCIGFIAAVIAAVKLKNEIGTVNTDTGWISLKNTDHQEHASEDFQRALKDAIGGGAGLHSVMTEDQLRQFNIERLAEILTPAIAQTHPHLTHSEVFFENLQQDKANWRCMGRLDKHSELKPFNKQAYDAEIQETRQAIRTNHANFIAEFGVGIFAKKMTKQSEEGAQAVLKHGNH